MLPLLARFNRSFSSPFFHHTQHYGAHTDGVTSISMHPVRTTLVLSLLAPLSEITIHPSSPASHLTPSNYLPSPSPSSPPLSFPPSLHCLSFPPSTVSLPLPPLSLSLLPSPQSGYYLVSTSRDSSIKIWDLREGRLLFTLQVRTPCSHVLINALSYLSICCAFITTSLPSLCLYFQGIFKLSNYISILLKSFLFWNAFVTFSDNQGHVGAVNAAAFSQDGHFFASGDVQQIDSLPSLCGICHLEISEKADAGGRKSAITYSPYLPVLLPLLFYSRTLTSISPLLA